MSNPRTPGPGALSRALAPLLNDMRELRGMSASELARLCGISQSQMSKYLRAERTLNVEQLDRICAALKISIAAVIREADSRR